LLAPGRSKLVIICSGNTSAHAAWKHNTSQLLPAAANDAQRLSSSPKPPQIKKPTHQGVGQAQGGLAERCHHGVGDAVAQARLDEAASQPVRDRNQPAARSINKPRSWSQ
jgi:hypothetical protein